jgi:hypothetical protein
MAPKKFKSNNAPVLTLEVEHEGRDWYKDDPAFTVNPGDVNSEVNIPIVAANLFIQKKKSARYQYTLNVNKMLDTLTACVQTPSSQGSMQLLIQAM